ncbi:MAG: tetratricopeptide repeat protein [Myxococcales bacterium]|nr:tetratricopeptide repeat protein [Myxococcales bacterium]
MRTSQALAAAFALLLVAGVARGEDRAAAKEHYKRATTLYDLRRYREAAKEYEAAFEAKDEPELLFNAAQAYRLGGEFGDAIALYRSFLRRAPAAPNRVEVEGLIEDSTALKAKQDELDRQKRESAEKPPPGKLPAAVLPVAAPPPPPETAPGASTESRRQRRIAGLAVGAGGVALVGAGIVFAVLASSAGNQISHPTPGQRFDPSLESKGGAFNALAITGLVVGGVAIAGGAALYILGRDPKGPALTLVPALGPGRAGASLDLRF